MKTYTYKETQAIVEAQAIKNAKLTNDQFKGLERNTEGDIIYLSDCFFLISDKQRDSLSEDDWSRMDNLEEDMRCMMAEFC